MPDNAVISVRPRGPVVMAAGETAAAYITVVVAEGYHVQANPASDEFLIPLRLKLRPRGGVRAGKAAYPQGRAYRLPGADKDWVTYDGTVEIVVPLEAQGTAKEGELLLSGVLRYQACDDRGCLFPSSVPVALPVRVIPALGHGRGRPRDEAVATRS